MIRKIEVEVPENFDLFRTEPGYVGAFTREQADGAIPNGSKVRKVAVEHGDAHPVGALAIVLGSIREPYGEHRIMYFLEWDRLPRHAVGCIAWKIEQVLG